MLKSSVSVAVSCLLVFGASVSLAGGASADDVESSANPTCKRVGVETVCTFDVAKMSYWTVPKGVTSVTADLYGAQGGFDGCGGHGGYTHADTRVTPGEKLQVSVGGTTSKKEKDAWKGGFNGGGNGSRLDDGMGFGGGGASDIRVGAFALKDRILVAGGGGGSNNRSCYMGGSGGGLNGGDAEFGGEGGTQQHGGKGDSEGNVRGKDGAFGHGGAGGKTNAFGSGGGGGGGWYGGGGGAIEASGGGGSGYASPVRAPQAVLESAKKWGDGAVTISYTTPPKTDSTDSDD